MFIHLDKPSDKLGLVVQMLHKLYALVGAGFRVHEDRVAVVPPCCAQFIVSHCTQPRIRNVILYAAAPARRAAQRPAPLDQTPGPRHRARAPDSHAARPPPPPPPRASEPPQVNQQCCEDNPDALTHHELLLPGHLLAKFAKEKLEDCLAALKCATTASLCFAFFQPPVACVMRPSAPPPLLCCCHPRLPAHVLGLLRRMGSRSS